MTKTAPPTTAPVGKDEAAATEAISVVVGTAEGITERNTSLTEESISSKSRLEKRRHLKISVEFRIVIASSFRSGS